MKLLLVLLVAAGSFISIQSSHASGCGGAEFYPSAEAKVLSNESFNAKKASYDIHLTTSLHEAATLSMSLYAEILPVKNLDSFFWHGLDLTGVVPENLSLQEVDLALNQESTRLEVVEDSFEINCATPDHGTQKNLRIRLPYRGQILEFKTHYLPDAKSW
jgi:hypothetical protein